MVTRPTARVLALLEILQTGGIHTAAELAGRLGVDERTARRYVDHLVDLDVPVWSERGRHGGYRLAPGHRLPPLMFTDDEALAVVLGLVAADRAGLVPAPGAAVESAAAKVRRVLPRRLGARLTAVLETAAVTAPRRPDPPTWGSAVLFAVAEAVHERRALALTYRSGDGRRSERTVIPDALVAHAGRWYVTGADSDSGEDRTFRLDRIATAAPLADPAPVRAAGEPAERLLAALARAPRRHAVSVVVQATREHIDRRVPPGLATVEPLDTGVRLRLQVEELEWVPSLLAWIDRPFVIEEPLALREHVHDLADRLGRCADATG